eukprot:3632771-Pyramimonas_sp.AAC.1
MKESDPFFKCGSRLSAAHIRYNKLRELHELRATRFQNVALAPAPRTRRDETSTQSSRRPTREKRCVGAAALRSRRTRWR